MCGLAVAIDWPDAEAAVRRLIPGILHRGDVTDPIVSPRANTAMCTRRLRIVDGDRAVQPQTSFDGRLVVSFNGEIYNYRDLKRELVELGVKFKTESDTEVLANALQVWGHKALQRFVGMFAFVAIDIDSGEFLAARDPFGVKPLYVIQTETGFLFCSEIQPLLQTVETGDVLLLPPGYLLTRKICAKYHSGIPAAAATQSQGDAATLDRLLREAIRIRLPQDLNFATQFSGGIDSTLVAHYARQFSPKAPGYFLGGPNAADYRYAAHFAEQTGFDLRLVPFDADSDAVFSLIGEVVECTETFEPGDVRGAVCAYVLAQRMHEDGFRVALCGDGADELFCGYPLLEQAFARDAATGRIVRDECLALMHRTCLQRVDRCSMRFQIETREPFLDPSVAGYALNLDAPSLVGTIGGAPLGKAALRRLYDLYPEQLPQLIRDRQKLPFDEGTGLDVSAAGSPWTTRFDALISDAALEDGMREFSLFDIRTKEELFYLRKLSQKMDVFRVPHLRDRVRITAPLQASEAGH
jgi:asparagine synthase (glutamine-hydrolysing)